MHINARTIQLKDHIFIKAPVILLCFKASCSIWGMSRLNQCSVVSVQSEIRGFKEPMHQQMLFFFILFRRKCIPSSAVYLSPKYCIVKSPIHIPINVYTFSAFHSPVLSDFGFPWSEHVMFGVAIWV